MASLKQRLASWLLADLPPAAPPPTDTVGVGAHWYQPQWLDERQSVPSIDSLVQEKGLGVYRDMQADDKVSQCLAIIAEAVLSAPLEITPGAEDDEAEEAAQFAAECFKYLDGQTSEDLCRDLLDALAMGFSLVQKVWREPFPAKHPWKGKVCYRKFISMPQETITFKTDALGTIEPDGVWQIDPARHNIFATRDPVHFAKYPLDRFVLWQWRKRYNNPLGWSLLRGAYDAWFRKRQAVLWWAQYLENFGMPWVEIEGPKQNLADALETVRRGMVRKLFAHTPDVKLGIISNTGTASNASFTQFIASCDAAISNALLNPSLLSANTDTGSRALGETHQDTFNWIVRSVQRSLAACIRSQIVQPLIERNYGDGIDCPNVQFAETDEGRMAALLTRIKGALEIGLEVGEQWARDALSVPAPIEDEPTLRLVGAANDGMDPLPEDAEDDGDPVAAAVSTLQKRNGNGGYGR